MKKYLSLLIFIIVISSSCDRLEIEKGTPKCVRSMIKDFSKEQSCNKGVSVKEYTFQNRTVYVFDPGTCGADQVASVIDADCNELGVLGGFLGNTKISGEEFSNAIFQNVVWEK